jgi:cytochrome c5
MIKSPLLSVTSALLLNAAFTLLVLSAAGCNTDNHSSSARTENLYVSHCARCHEVGAANAPKRGDTQAWEKRLRKGEDALIASIKKGVVAMPPMGDCQECTDEDLKALIAHLAQ